MTIEFINRSCNKETTQHLIGNWAIRDKHEDNSVMYTYNKYDHGTKIFFQHDLNYIN